MTTFKNIALLLLMLSIASIVHAQQKSGNDIPGLLNTLQKAYNSVTDSTLSFRVHYTYTNETRPDSLLDTVNGFFQLNTNRYHYLIDSTEIISNDSVQVVLFKAEKIMYLAKTKVIANPIQNPLAMLDSSLRHIEGLVLTNESVDGEEKINMRFPEGMQYKTISFTIDQHTHYIKEVAFVVRTSAMLDTGDEEHTDLSGYDEYATIKASYYDYKTEPVSSSVFDNSHLYVQQNGQIQPSHPYSDYQVFVGTSGF